MEEYITEVSQCLAVLSRGSFSSFIDALERKLEGSGHMFVAGNGGSHSIAEHFSTDLSKGVFQKTGNRLKVQSLISNMSLLTATSNDVSYEESMSLPLTLLADSKDSIFLISSSGASPNIIKAAEISREIGCTIFSLSGFGESPLSEISDYNIKIDSQDYQLIEDCHSVLCHSITKYFLK